MLRAPDAGNTPAATCVEDSFSPLGWVLLQIINDQAARFPEFRSVNARLVSRPFDGADTAMTGIGHDDATKAAQLTV